MARKCARSVCFLCRVKASLFHIGVAFWTSIENGMFLGTVCSAIAKYCVLDCCFWVAPRDLGAEDHDSVIVAILA